MLTCQHQQHTCKPFLPNLTTSLLLSEVKVGSPQLALLGSPQMASYIFKHSTYTSTAASTASCTHALRSGSRTYLTAPPPPAEGLPDVLVGSPQLAFAQLYKHSAAPNHPRCKTLSTSIAGYVATPTWQHLHLLQHVLVGSPQLAHTDAHRVGQRLAHLQGATTAVKHTSGQNRVCG
jgi:hypothetical protein